ncbi:MAG TPA: Ig-like domain-containing protein, partial [Planctomycetaceae bacterium]
DPLRRHLLVTTADGTVERLDLTDMRLLDPFKVGSSLLGADIAPDGGSLYVAESVRNVTQGFVRKVSLADGSVTNLAYDLAGLESGAYDIAITADGRALVTTLFAGSGWIPLRVLDLATGTFSNPTGLRSVRQNTDLYRSADRSRVLLLEGNISSGPVHVYDAATGGFPAGITTDTFVTYYPAAVNRDGSLNAIGFSGLAVYDANLRPVPAPVLSDRTTGLAFDPTRDVLYRAGSTEITVFETGSFTELFRFPIGETLSSKTPMAVSDDGRFLFLGTAAGVRVYRLAADARRVTLAAGQAVTDADFLNRSVTNNRRPAAADDAFSVAEDGALTGNLFANDSDPDGDPLSVIQVSGRAESVGTPITLPSGALLTVNADGTFAYDPNGRFRWLGPGETDTDTFTYSVSDGWGGTATARVKVTIEGVDDLPVTPVLRETVWEHESVTIYLPYDIDPDSESQIVSLDTAGTRGTIAFGDYHIEYTPGDAFDHLGPDETATETFRYTVEDDLGNASTGLVTVTILGEDDLAVVKDDVATTSEDKPVTGNVLANDSDIDTPLRVAALNGVAADIGRRVRLGTSSEPRGYLTLKADGSFVFDPAGNFEWLNAGFDGPEEVTFTYTLSDGETGTVTVAVEGVNDPPRVEPGDFSTGESESFTDRLFGMFADRHPEGDLVSVAAVNGDASAVGRAFRLPSGAIVTVEADGRFTYDPNGAFVRLRYGERADDVFTYTAADGYGGRAAVAVEVTVWGGGGEADLSAFYRGEWWVAESSGTPRFLSRRWAGWADVPWDALRHGDFDGDGRSDVLGLLDGQWWVGLSSGSSYQARLWTTWADVDWKDVTVGDLDGNGKDDLLARHGGRWWAALSFGYGFTAPLVWTAWADAAWRNVTLTDLDADGDADLLGYLRGQWWAALSTGGSFAAATLRAHWTDVAWEALGTFDADGDGRTDVYGLLGGEWWVGRSAGGVFATSLRAKWAAVPWRDAVAGDFDGDGRDDLAARHAGEWWVGLSAAGGSGGPTASWARWADTAWKDLRVADFDGDGRDDLAARYGGQWWVGASTGSAFATTLWATWADVAWKAVAAAETNVPAATGGGSSGSGITLSGSSSSSSFTLSLPAPVRPPSAPIAPVSTIDEEESLAHFWSKADEDEDLAAGLLTAR